MILPSPTAEERNRTEQWLAAERLRLRLLREGYTWRFDGDVLKVQPRERIGSALAAEIRAAKPGLLLIATQDAADAQLEAWLTDGTVDWLNAREVLFPRRVPGTDRWDTFATIAAGHFRALVEMQRQRARRLREQREGQAAPTWWGARSRRPLRPLYTDDDLFPESDQSAVPQYREPNEADFWRAENLVELVDDIRNLLAREKALEEAAG